MRVQLSPHFFREEFACKCPGNCGADTVDAELLDLLEEVRQEFSGNPITITSGHRCEYWNTLQGGSAHSEHLVGRAADFRIQNVDMHEVYDYLDLSRPEHLGLGLYSGWIHLDTRAQPARWTE